MHEIKPELAGQANDSPRPDIKSVANYEGNASELFYDRLHDPEILKQLVDLIYEYQQTLEPPDEHYENDEDGKLTLVTKDHWTPSLQSKEEIMAEVKGRIERVYTVTNLDYSETGRCSGDINGGIIAINSRNFETGQKWTAKQLAIIEAHEKGHGIRDF